MKDAPRIVIHPARGQITHMKIYACAECPRTRALAQAAPQEGWATGPNGWTCPACIAKQKAARKAAKATDPTQIEARRQYHREWREQRKKDDAQRAAWKEKERVRLEVLERDGPPGMWIHLSDPGPPSTPRMCGKIRGLTTGTTPENAALTEPPEHLRAVFADTIRPVTDWRNIAICLACIRACPDERTKPLKEKKP